MLLRYCLKCGIVYEDRAVRKYDTVGFKDKSGCKNYKLPCKHNASDTGTFIVREC